MEERKSRYELFLEEEARKAQPTKRCSKCGKEKSITLFHKGSGKYGRWNTCKTCRASGKKYKSADDWFWKHYWKKAIREGDCLVWSGTIAGDVPVCTRNKKRVNLRRLVYSLAIGELHDDMIVMMTCTTRNCVKQSHMRLATKEELFTKIANHQPSGDNHYLKTHPELHPRGENHPMSKLSEIDVREIRDRYNSKAITQAELGREFGISDVMVSAIIRRKSWAHVE